MKELIGKWLGPIIRKDKAQFLNKTKKYQTHDIGNWSYGNPTILSYGSKSKLSIGKYCSIAEGVVILLGGEHRLDWVTTYPFSVLLEGASKYKGHPTTKGDIKIGNDVWIGRDALIFSGVVIGDGAVIGARSVVTSNIPPYAIAAGNPAKIVRYRFNEEIIQELLDMAWWDWPATRIEEALPLMLSADIAGFIAKYKDARMPSSGY